MRQTFFIILFFSTDFFRILLVLRLLDFRFSSLFIILSSCGLLSALQKSVFPCMNCVTHIFFHINRINAEFVTVNNVHWVRFESYTQSVYFIRAQFQMNQFVAHINWSHLICWLAAKHIFNVLQQFITEISGILGYQPRRRLSVWWATTNMKSSSSSSRRRRNKISTIHAKRQTNTQN